MKRVARDFTVVMEVPNNIAIGRCEIVIKVESANYVVRKKGFAGRDIKGFAKGKNVQIDFGPLYQEVKI
jgi:hypothetical protein